ncbi:hypothetical protein G6F22_016137 [Rhizopus arrhizus]|nr:hypothetical protein G6F22_016137 [Rhizopus arrhizus]KAG1184853.1 hypothetical protein G6F35_015001 [Rhizopus arrhizus]
MNRPWISASRNLFLRTTARQCSLTRARLTVQFRRNLTQSVVRPISFKGIFRSSNEEKRQVLLEQDNLFHVLSKSPLPEMRDRASMIKKYGTCPVCESEGHKNKPTYDCPDCGYPTHCCEEHHHQGREAHKEVCSVLRQVNEDDHDLRSGRSMKEFEFPSKKTKGFVETIVH